MRRALAFAWLALALPAAAAEANSASQADLESVKGIGPALSERILAARRERPFRDWADFLRRVGGGERAAARLSAAGLTVGGAAFPPASPAQTPASASAASSAAKSAAPL